MFPLTSVATSNPAELYTFNVTKSLWGTLKVIVVDGLNGFG